MESQAIPSPLSGVESRLKQLRGEAVVALDRILDWWETRMPDELLGGFYGRIDGFGRVHPMADKGVILNTRILWTFSEAARAYPEKASWKLIAHRAFDYLIQYFWDGKEGGLFWMLDCYGKPVQDKKQIYAQAFGIYALAAYYQLTQNRQALDRATELFWLIEQYSFDRKMDGYWEAFSRDWKPLSDLRLSEKDANEAKTMNTHLHVLEAYTALYRIAPGKELAKALRGLICLFAGKFIDQGTGHLRLFFDEDWVLKSESISFGHDIEASWLLQEAGEALNDPELIETSRRLAVFIAETTILEGADADGGLFNEAGPGGIVDRGKDWWPQAEAIVGFLNAWQVSGDVRFAMAALRSWDFIQGYLLDEAEGEWYWALSAKGLPDRENDKAVPWKCPYHNGRACLEIVRRLNMPALG